MINLEKQKEMEKRLGCTFCDDGKFAEMYIDLSGYNEQTKPIENVVYQFYDGQMDDMKQAVNLVDKEWVQYFNNRQNIFCGYVENQLASFCLIDIDVDCMISTDNCKVGSIGCVGTLPQYRKNGIGLRMVDLATVYLKEKNCDKSYVSYTHIDKWYEKLGYQTFARFTFDK